MIHHGENILKVETSLTLKAIHFHDPFGCLGVKIHYSASYRILPVELRIVKLFLT